MIFEHLSFFLSDNFHNFYWIYFILNSINKILELKHCIVITRTFNIFFIESLRFSIFYLLITISPIFALPCSYKVFFIVMQIFYLISLSTRAFLIWLTAIAARKLVRRPLLQSYLYKL